MEIKRIVVGQLETNCYLLASKGEAIIIDPGDEARKIAKEVEAAGVAVKSIINTHNHFDHIGANNELKIKFGAKLLIDRYDDNGRAAADDLLKDGDVIKIGQESLKVAETPGHTKGSVCLFGIDFVISGDTLFEDGFGRTDLPGGSNLDMAASLKKLDSMIPEGTVVYPGHGNIFNYRKGMAAVWLNYLN
jgi:glyoxylase-like metal-dependent hydrolase (beta-lactamase superfamily II)